MGNQTKVNFITFIFVLFCIFNIKESKAAVHFITKTENIYSLEDRKPCQVKGYTITKVSCTLNRTLFDKCPSGEFWKQCKCESKYKFNTSNCAENMLRGDICNNSQYTECGCDEKDFPYTKENCPSPMVLEGTPNCNNTNFKECNCPSEYKTCSAGMIGDSNSGKCGKDKFKKCICDPSIYFNCSPGKGAVGAKSCTDSSGTKYSNCETAACPSGTVDYNTYWNGELKYFIDKTKRVKTINSRLCATLPTCSEIGFNMNCSGHNSIKCPFDISKEFCLKSEPEISCVDGGYVNVIPTGQICAQISYNGKTCYKDCKATGPVAKTHCTNNYGYYNNNTCSNFVGINCAQKYQQMGQQCSQQGNTPSHDAGVCDVDSWRGCCEECNGSF